jgi:hypothetical protein
MLCPQRPITIPITRFWDCARLGRTGLIPLSETGVVEEADVARAFPVGADVEVSGAARRAAARPCAAT